MQDRERLLAQVFVRLADTLVDDFDVVEFLQRLAADAVEILGVATAGVMLSDGRGGLRLLASSEERMRLLELFELQNQEGPCMDAFHNRRPVAASADEGRRLWPQFAPAAAEQGFQFMCATPLQLRGNTLGALNLFRNDDTPFTSNDMAVANAMAKVAATGLLQQRSLNERQLLAEQLQTALQSRVVIEQAKGVLAEYLDISVDEAFQQLRRRARNTNRKLTELARDVATRNVNARDFQLTDR
ncbi:MAG: hypothetical protein QOJ32_1088 [Frankiaceae bacterium]|jgi:GAF domain-containing protein|nr:hypothetical protein [Frankiaceae bacterium]MDQ1647991.1 hypothetical protein [Frankiaceae bacterium]MDQ1673260.1 hypothetical protein [Frankiaceae bacterium]